MDTVDFVVYVLASAPAWWLMWRARPLPRANSARPPVSVVIPARDEEHNIASVVRSVLDQRIAGDEVIVVDDGSSDGTAAAAAGAGARVVPAGTLPAGWLGKPHACSVGADRAVNDVLVFIDADVRLHDGALSRVVAAVEAERDALTSVQPFHVPQRWGEHAALFFNVVSVVASGAGERHDRALVFGPLLACSTERYRTVGGHAADSVRGSVVEDIALGASFERTRVFLGSPGTVTFRMYPHGLASLFHGFSKNAVAGASKARGWSLVAAVAWVAAQTGAVFTSPLLYIVAAIQTWVMGRRVGRFGVVDAVCFPVHLVVFSAVLVRSALVRVGLARVLWAGRRVR